MLYFVRFILFMTDAVNEFLSKNCPYIAGAISFYTLFSIFPLLLAVISVSGFVLGPTAEREQLAIDIAEVMPVSAQFISETMQGVVGARTITGIASGFGILWTSTAAFGAMRKGVNAAWGVKQTRPFIRERLIDFALTFAAGILLVALLLITPTIGFFSEITGVFWPEAEFAKTFWSIVAQTVTPVITFVAFIVLYKFLPNSKVSLGDVWLGALLAALAFEVAKLGFVTYIKTFPVYNVVYGSVGAVMALLTWVYVSAIILLFGALLTSRYSEQRVKAKREVLGPKFLWTELSRVRLRDVVSPGTG